MYTDSEEEYWVYVPNFPEYVVSNHGNIKRTGSKGGRPLSKKLNENGDVVVTLHVGFLNNERYRFRLDRIVVAAFQGAFSQEPLIVDIVHKDGDPFNCRSDNLTWTRRN